MITGKFSLKLTVLKLRISLIHCLEDYITYRQSLLSVNLNAKHFTQL